MKFKIYGNILDYKVYSYYITAFMQLVSTHRFLNFHSRTVHLDIIKVFTPTDAQVFFKSIKIYITTAPTCFSVITILRVCTNWFRTVQQTYTSKDLITYAATPPD
jgi:hypothetical protein